MSSRGPHTFLFIQTILWQAGSDIDLPQTRLMMTEKKLEEVNAALSRFTLDGDQGISKKTDQEQLKYMIEEIQGELDELRGKCCESTLLAEFRAGILDNNDRDKMRGDISMNIISCWGFLMKAAPLLVSYTSWEFAEALQAAGSLLHEIWIEYEDLLNSYKKLLEVRDETEYGLTLADLDKLSVVDSNNG